MKSLGAASLAALLLFVWAPIHAQTSSAAGEIMCACPGLSKPLGSAPDCNAACFGAGNGGAMPAPPSPAAMMADMAGQLLGQFIRSTMREDPAAAARQQAQAAAWNAELERIRAEQERHMEEARDRLLGTLKDVTPPHELAFKGLDSGRELGFKMGDAATASSAGLDRPQTLADIPFGSIGAQLASAVYFSNAAADAGNGDDAATLAQAGFDSVLGIPVEAQVPKTAPLASLSDADADGLRSLRNDYFKASDEAQQAEGSAAGLEQQRAFADQVLDRAEAELKAARNGTGKYDVSTAERLVAEARTLPGRLEKELSEAAAQRDKAQRRMVAASRSILDALDSAMRRTARSPKGAASESAKPKGQDRRDSSGNQHEKDAYVRGIQEASDCMPPNAQGYCSGLSSSGSSVCVQNYSNGFQVGQRIKLQRLQRAYAQGQDAKKQSRPLSSAAHPDAAGVCGVHWVEAFNEGYFGRPFHEVGR